MRLKLVAVAAAFAAAALLAPQRAAAQEGAWFFCYVDPPTFGRGPYVYTRVNYIGSAVIPQDEIAAAMAADSPQVAGRAITCWRYATQAEAESRRQAGMASDRGRDYSIREIGWTSPYSAPPVPEAPIADDVAAAPPTPAPVAAPVGDAGSKPSTSAKPVSHGDTYARAMVEYEKSKADYARQQAQYARALQDQKQRTSALAGRKDEVQEQYERQRAQWEADVEACKAGDRSKCAKPQE